MRRVLLIIVLACGAVSCAHPKPPAADIPSITAWWVPDEAEDDDLVCSVVPTRFPYAPYQVGKHCLTVKALRWWLTQQQAAN